MSDSAIAILGVGMTTAVGYDAQTSCASFRAGINRISELDYIEYFDDEESEVVAITGHVASPNGMATEGLGKMLSLGVTALDDLVKSCGPFMEQPENRIGFFVALPDYTLRQDEESDIGNAVTQGDVNDVDEEALFSEEFIKDCDDYLVFRLMRGVDCKFRITKQNIIYGDHCCFLLALEDAVNAIKSGEVDQCIVGGIDSYIDSQTIDWALANNRLKTSANPSGFLPGEAAVFILIDRQDRVVARGGKVVARLGMPVLGCEKGHSDSEKNPTGEGLSLTIKKALEETTVDDVAHMVGNLNGEVSYAIEWGRVNSKLLAESSTLANASQWYPSESFGEVGCANIGLSIGVCVHAFNRKYSKSNSILIWNISDSSHRGALLVTKEET